MLKLIVLVLCNLAFLLILFSHIAAGRTIIVFAIIGRVLGIVFCIIMILTRWNVFTFPIILLFAVTALFCWYKFPKIALVPAVTITVILGAIIDMAIVLT